jgi:hypothetical protein
VSSFLGDALAGAARRSEIFRYQRLEILVGYRRHIRVWRPGPARHRVVEETEAELVVDREAEQEAHNAQKLTESSGNVLGYEAKARVTEEEFASFQEEFEAAISRHGKVCLLLYMPEMPGVDPGSARSPEGRE